ncbi:MAG: hypothetical protein PHE88_02575 [Elusimicrobia bacterium]|nr:hypothetical protein [Elusimicrobiota bacterium]
MIIICIFLLGFVSLGFQIILVREVLVLFSENELTIGIFLASWMLVVAFGSYIAGRFSYRIKNLPCFSDILILLTGIIMPLEIFSIRFAGYFFQRTLVEMIGIIPTFAFSFIAVFVIGLLFGCWFVLATEIYSKKEKYYNTAGKSYTYETTGSVVGGLATSIFLIK